MGENKEIQYLLSVFKHQNDQCQIEIQVWAIPFPDHTIPYSFTSSMHCKVSVIELMCSKVHI